MPYFQVKVTERFENEKGKETKVNRLYLVQDVVIDGAKPKVDKLYEGTTLDYEVVGITPSKVYEVVE